MTVSLIVVRLPHLVLSARLLWPARTSRCGRLGAMATVDAVILVGGMGTRLRPLTLSAPKPMLPTAGVPFLDHLMARIRDAGITHVVLGTSYRAEVFEDVLRRRHAVRRRTRLRRRDRAARHRRRDPQRRRRRCAATRR